MEGQRRESPFRESVEQLARVPLPSTGQRVDVRTLTEAFALFNETTQRLEKAHRELEKRVQQVDAELERKNRELAQANRDLQTKIAELDRTRSYLNNLIDSMGSGLVSVDCEGRITTINRAAQQMTGWDEARVLSGRWESLVAPENQGEVAVLIDSKALRQNLDLCLLDCQGGRMPVRGTTAPILDENGEPLGVILTFIDQSSVRLLEERVRRAGRLAALGELAAGVAHEMRNPLTTIRGFIQIYPGESRDPEFRKEFGVNVLREIDRLTKLTEDLLNLAKPIDVNFQQVDGGELLEEVATFVSEKLEQNRVQGEVDTPPERLLVPMDRDRIKQVLLNLIFNALEAMPEGGALRLAVRQVRERLESSAQEDPFALFEVADSGEGIALEDQERVFDPFYTTKGTGTGLGLAVSHRIVEEHRGFLRVGSTLGEGTTFTLLLPLDARQKVEDKR